MLLTEKGKALKLEAAQLLDCMNGKLGLEPGNMQQMLDTCQQIRSRLR